MFKSISFAIITILLIGGVAFGQNMIIGANATYTGSGTYNVKGNIDNSARSELVIINGTVNLTGANQAIGNDGSPGIIFVNFNPMGSDTKTQNVEVTVTTAYEINGTANYNVNGKTLNLDGSATRTAGTLTADGDGSTVNYRRNEASQTVIDATYTNLNLLNNAGKSLQGDVTAGTMTHAGGNLTVNHNLTITNTGTLATVANVEGGKSLTFGTGPSSIATLSAVAATGSVVNGSGPLTITNLAGNAGTITAAANGGAMTFTNAAVNSGDITGGAGLVTFANTLSHSTGTVTAGTGKAQFDGDVTINSGSITAGNDAELDFNANIVNKADGTLSLTGNGKAFLFGSFAEQLGRVDLAIGSTFTYDGADQAVAGGGLGVTYGNLIMAGTDNSTKTALGDMTVLGNFDNGGAGNLAITTDVKTFALTIDGAKENTNSTMKFEGVNNGLIFEQGTVDYYAAAGNQNITGHATQKYETLLLSGGGTKTVQADTRVATSGNLTINSGVTAVVADATSLLNVDLDLINNGEIQNAGTVNVGGE